MQAINRAMSAPAQILQPAESVDTWRTMESIVKDTIRQKETELLEMQHRIANSLQIITSILQTKARVVQSNDTRGHLQDACQRVMSVAAIQEHLTASRHGDAVAVGPYLQWLCETLSQSMIGGDRSIAVTVSAAEGDRPTSDVMGLGRIVTELLINAVKYAFPDPAACGKIGVSYRTGPAGWSLEVSDNGIGFAAGADGTPTSGLGTRIVSAIARRLDARLEVSSSEAGTRVSIRQLACAHLDRL